LLVVAIALLAFVRPGLIAAEEIPLKPPLEARISLDKDIIAADDRVTIFGIITNYSSERVAIFRKLRGYTIGYVKMSDDVGRLLRGTPLIKLALRPDAVEDFTELAPGKGITLTFPATLREEPAYDIKTGTKYMRGLFLNFGTSSITIPRKGKYEMRFEFAVNQTLRDGWAKSFGFQNLWYGTIVSDPVVLTIK
jgi:hypothetical protein